MSSMLLMLSMIYLGHSPIFKQESLKMNIGDMVSAFFTSPGPGGIVILTVVTLAAVVYFFLIRWIMAGGKSDDEK